MAFPPNMIFKRRLQASPAPFSAAETVLRKKLAALVARHAQVKIAYKQLHSQIKLGLSEAGDVFSSLAIPLMKLVGLKTTEMASEGRLATIFLHTDSILERDRVGATRTSSMKITRDECGTEYMKNQIHSPKGANYAAKAETAGRELMENQRRQLMQLVQILRHIETQVNSCEENILQTIYRHRNILHKVIQEAVYYINTLHSQNQDTFLVTVKLLRSIFNNVNKVLGSVECGVEDLMQALAETMCKPMVQYANNLKDEIKLGPCAQLMCMVNNMERANADTRRELEDARARIRLAEEAKTEMLCRLKKTEEQVQIMKHSLESISVSQRKPADFMNALRRPRIEGNQENDEKLLWEILRKQSKQKVAESPMGTKDLNKNNSRQPYVYHRPMTRTQKRLNNRTPSRSIGWISVGSSPREVRSSKRNKRF